MDMTIIPFVSNSDRRLNWSHVNDKIGKHSTRNRPPITYWGIFLDGKKYLIPPAKSLLNKAKFGRKSGLTKKTNK
jgi:hypothetical protein